ncbi:MAG: GntR family transcriptional regulator [Pseudomonadota bacterium]
MVYQFYLDAAESAPPPPAEQSAALPVYVQVSELLIRDIAAGRLMDGARLPPERTMAADHGIAVGTLRKALAILEGKGLLERVQGSGNYVRYNARVDSIYAMFRLELPGGGGLPRAEVIDTARQDKGADLPPFGTAKTATRIRRRRYLNDTLVALEEIWLDGAAGTVDAKALSESLYQHYRKALGFTISKAEDRVSVAPVPPWSEGHFTRTPGEMVGLVERLAWADSPAPVEFSRTWFDPDRAHYVQRLR